MPTDKSNKRILVYIATFLLLVVIIAFMTPLLLRNVVADQNIINVLNLFLGMIATHLLNILKDASGFEFGDSKSSQAKSEAAQQTQVVTADALAQANKTIEKIATGETVAPDPKKEPT